MKKVIHNLGGQLVCDACDYVGPHTEFSSALLDEKCPECGAALLTKNQVRKIRRVNRGIWVFNFLFGWLFGSNDEPKGDVVTYGMHVTDHGTHIFRRRRR